jgi:hypothetical protein
VTGAWRRIRGCESSIGKKKSSQRSCRVKEKLTKGGSLDLQHFASQNSGRRLTLLCMLLGQLEARTGRSKGCFSTYDECMQGRDIDLRLGSGYAPPVFQGPLVRNGSHRLCSRISHSCLVLIDASAHLFLIVTSKTCSDYCSSQPGRCCAALLSFRSRGIRCLAPPTISNIVLDRSLTSSASRHHRQSSCPLRIALIGYCFDRLRSFNTILLAGMVSRTCSTNLTMR